MVFNRIVVLCIFSAICASQGLNTENYIANGQIAENYPHHVYISFSSAAGGFFGGGSIISSRHVLTVAQIVRGFTQWQIGYGSTVFAQLSWVTTTETIVHPNYNLDTRDNDIAILVLPSDLTLTPQVQPIALPPVNENLPGEGQQGLIMGFGWTLGQQQQSPNLMVAQINVIADQRCQTFVLVSFPNHFCALNEIQPANFCQGDLGGGFLVNHNGQLTLAGMNSILLEGCAANFPSAYTRVGVYRMWIKDITGV